MGWVTQQMARMEMDIPEKWGGQLTKEELALPWFQLDNLTTFFPSPGCGLGQDPPRDRAAGRCGEEREGQRDPNQVLPDA